MTRAQHEEGGINLERPAPPEHCLVPCIWELISQCNRRMCCLQFGTSAGCYQDGSFRWSGDRLSQEGLC